jgi:hypothetical protein
MKDKGSAQLVCLPRRLTEAQLLEAARHAININPMNRPPVERMAALAARGISRESCAGSC